jgi:hypothetical protein
MNELLPCPFCGESAVMNDENGWVMCPRCDISQPNVETWNRRTPPGDGGIPKYPVELRLAELEDILERVTDAFDSEHESYVAVLGGRHRESCQTCNLLVEAKEAIGTRKEGEA